MSQCSCVVRTPGSIETRCPPSTYSQLTTTGAALGYRVPRLHRSDNIVGEAGAFVAADALETANRETFSRQVAVGVSRPEDGLKHSEH